MLELGGGGWGLGAFHCFVAKFSKGWGPCYLEVRII